MNGFSTKFQVDYSIVSFKQMPLLMWRHRHAAVLRQASLAKRTAMSPFFVHFFIVGTKYPTHIS